MNKLYSMLAEVDVSDVVNAQTQFANSQSNEILIIFGALALAVVVAGIWAVLYSKKNRQGQHHKSRQPRNHSVQAKSANSAAEMSSANETNSRKKKRRTGRPHRPMNPTLAQTGGLPPLRGENTPLPPMP